MFKSKKTFFRLIACTLVLAMALTPFMLPFASAEQSLEDMQDQYAALEKSIAKNEKALKGVQNDISTNESKLKTINSQISDIKSQLSLLDKRMDVLNGSINELQPQISSLSATISDVENTIKTLEEDIERAQQESEETQDAVLERVREDYMSGGNASILEILLTSDDLSTFLSRAELMERATESDAALIDDLAKRAEELDALKKEANHKKTELELKKSQLDSKMSQLESNQNDLQNSVDAAQGKQNSLNSKYAEVNDILDGLDKDSAAYKAQIKRQYEEKEALSREIDNYIATHGSSQGEEVPPEYIDRRSSSGLIWPVPYSNSYVSCAYGYYSDGTPHKGMDIVVRDSSGNNISSGKKIVAAQSGTVIMAYNNGGYNSGFGNYCVIDHGNGIMTLYAHCAYLTVSEGNIVSQGQQIGAIGLTGNTTGYHVHFEVRIKNEDGSVSRVNPANYVSK